MKTQPFYSQIHSNTMNDTFDTLVEEAFYSYMEFRPDIATELGLHQYDKEMPSGKRVSHLTFIKTLDDYLQEFQDIDEVNLSEDRRFERRLMISTLKCNLLQEKEIRKWEKDPDPAETIGFAVYVLFIREFAPFEERLESITARLTKCPQFIEDFKSRITEPIKLWVDIATESCETLPVFFQTISTTATQKELDTSELDEAAAKTTEALSDYTEWLKTLSCEAEFAIGRELFEKLLAVRELGLTADEILRIGETYLEKEKARLKKLASEINPSLSVEEVRTSIREDHPPTFEETLKEYEKAMTRMRKIVHEKGFASLPEGERLIVRETPSFVRHVIPVAAYMSPAKFEEDQMGVYVVTPMEGDLLGEHNYTAIQNTSVHEAYPGHHLQLTWANKHPSLVRILSDAPEFVEGWAHYCEERMQDYVLKDNKVKFVQALDAILRAARIIIDVKMHCGDMTFDEAVSFLEKETGMGHDTAVGEVKWYTKEPTYPLSYLLGKHLLLQLQEEVQTHMKDRYSDKAFHDVLLQGGSLPFAYLKEELKLKGML